MAHTIKASNVSFRDKSGHLKQLIHKYIVPVLFWVPNTYGKYQVIRSIHRELARLESEIFRYKLHWGFKKDSSSVPQSSNTVASGEDVQASRQSFLVLDDLDEAVRSLIFQLNSYTFLEKLVHFDVVKHEAMVRDYRRDFTEIISCLE